MSSDLQKLKGKMLKSVTWDDGEITFHCDDRDWTFDAVGDCCSKTYIESVEGPKRGRIYDVKEPSMPYDCNEIKEWEFHKFYKATLEIEGSGYLDVTYRNESNGYYGGSLELREDTKSLGSA